jgi:chromate transport protein ChrA
MLMTAFAYGAGALGGPIGLGVLHGLKLVAVAIVAQAVWGMARTLCPDRQRASIACVAALMILFSTSSLAQIGAILMGGIAGFGLCRTSAPHLGTGRWGYPSRACRRAGANELFCAARCTSGTGRIVARRSNSSTPSTAPVRWCLAAAMSCCRY